MDGVTTAMELEVGTGDIDRWYAVREGKASINYGVSVGHIPVRMAVMKDPGAFLPSGPAAHRAATAERDCRDHAGIERGLRRGAVAVGFGIAYTPDAEGWEIIEVFKAAARFGASAHVHIRGGEAAGRPHGSRGGGDDHRRAASRRSHAEQRRGADRAAAVDDRRCTGARLDVTTEMYPYIAGQTHIESALFDGWEQYPDSRFQNYLWPATGERLTRESFARYRKTGGPIIMFSNTEEVVRGAAASPLTMIASDGGQTPTHPRTAGTFSRILGPYVRDEQGVDPDGCAEEDDADAGPAPRTPRPVDEEQRTDSRRRGCRSDGVRCQRIADQSTYEQPARSSIGISTCS